MPFKPPCRALPEVLNELGMEVTTQVQPFDRMDG